MVNRCSDGSIEFRFFRRDATAVTLAGDFNLWQTTSLPMRHEGDGWWSCRLRLGSGTYQFKYRADNEWFADYAAFGLEHGPFGWNSVLFVSYQGAKSAMMDRQSVRRRSDAKVIGPIGRQPVNEH